MTRYEKGMELINKLHGPHTGGQILEATREVAPDLLQFVAEFAMADIFNRPHLDHKTREFIIIAIMVTLGTLPQLKAHIQSAFECGATKEELSEVLLQTIPISGFPLASNALMVLKEVLEERASKN